MSGLIGNKMKAKNAKIPLNGVKSGLFTFNTAKLFRDISRYPFEGILNSFFKISTTNFVHIFIVKWLFTYISLLKINNGIFRDVLLTIFRILNFITKKLKIREWTLIGHLNYHLLRKINLFCPYNSTLNDDSSATLFLTEIGRTGCHSWRHLMSTYQDLEKNPWSGCEILMKKGVYRS